MAGTTGPRVGLVWGYAPGEAGWGVGGFNPNFAKLEALVHLTVIAVAATPPATPANGDCYIVAASPTGAWVGHADDIAVYYTSGGWLYIDPAIGIRAFDRSGDGYIRFDGVDWIDEIVPAADVSGPAGAVDGNIAVLDITGKVIRDGGKGLPSGLIVGTTDIQIIENKVIDGADNSLVVHLDTDVAGNLPIVNLGGGVGASNTTAWFGDGTWKPVTTGGGGSASITVSDTPPASPEGGQMWFDSTTACLFIWYEDSSGGQWVVAVNVGSGGGGVGVLSISATGPLVASGAVGDVTLSLDAPLGIAFGGHGADTAAQALVNLGAASILSPVLLGTPTGPTASPGTATGQLATTAFVANAFGGAGALSITAGVGITVTPNPLTGVGSVALSVPIQISSGGTGAVSAPAALVALGAAPIDNPVFTGDARAVTPATADNDTSIATTAYVKAQGYVTGGPYLPTAGGTITGVTAVAFADASPYQLRVAGTTTGLRFRTAPGLAAIEATDQTGSASFQPLALGGSTVSLTISGTAKMIMDAAGITTFFDALAVGTVPPASPGASNIFCNGVIGTSHASGCYYNGGWKYFQGGGVVANVLVMDGNISFYCAPTGTAGAAVPLTERMRIDNATGATLNTSGSWTVLSDVSLKETVQPYERGLDAILALNPVTFQYAAGTPFAATDEPSDPLVGLIASEVEPHIPEMCGITMITIRDEPREVQTLNPGDLVYVLINSIKQLEARVRELEERPPNPPEVKPA